MDVSAGHTRTVKLVQVQLMQEQLHDLDRTSSWDKLGTFVDQPCKVATSALA
jgi:hypothetical protein